MVTKVNGAAIAAIGTGALLTWSGVKGWSILATAGDMITGHKPKGGNQYGLVSGSNGSNSGIAGNTTNDIANDALRYQGHAYSYGGTPGKNGDQPWDCSSFVNWVVGHDAGRPIPGYSNGTYDGSTHGPPTGSWGIWPGLKHISQSQLQAGDLIVWVGHMGIAVDNTHMVSALNSQLGTIITPIAGNGNGPLMCYGRL